MAPDSTGYRTSIEDLAWPAFPSPWAANKLALLFQIEQSQWLRPEAIALRQFQQVRKLVAFATQTVPHYRQALGKRIAANDLSPESWADVPVLSRRAVFESGRQLQSERIPREHGRTYPQKTSGSTGMVVEILGTDLTNLYWQVFCLREHLWHRRDLREKLCAVRFQRDPAMKGATGVASLGWGPATDDIVVTGPSVIYDIQQNIPPLVEQLSIERPGYLLSHPSMALGLARHCLEHGILIPGLKEIRTLGEEMAPSLRALCREAWNVPVVDMYTCQEAGYLALQCPQHTHYHVQAENVLLEVVDDHGRPCRPGETGRVLITSLNNFATPLIRYEIGDYAEVGQPCECGRGLPVLNRIMGRYRNLLTLPGGVRRWGLIGIPNCIAPIEEMQLIQTSLSEVRVHLVMPRPLDSGERDRLAEYIRGNLGHPFRLEFDYVQSIRNSANGKVEQIISLLDTDPASG